MIDPNLVHVIASIESNNRREAIRYERAVHQQVINGLYESSVNECRKWQPSCSLYTARMICSTSWGLYQIMGFNIYDTRFMFRKTLVEFLESTGEQTLLLEQFLNSKDINYRVDAMLADAAMLERFVRLYNGPGNVPAYTTRFTDKCKECGFA